ncbi:hypothetical protein Taro_044793 [Colocasia esculenta]|uniref:Uncharacterized protein n=1 Tax=Colocasia esculenta TaxID=4460 RepID=A0A843WMS8_COLES|nr:hypothetical protein [Colocasia esculenta]
MGFVSFVGRVLFASVFLLSAYQEIWLTQWFAVLFACVRVGGCSVAERMFSGSYLFKSMTKSVAAGKG